MGRIHYTKLLEPPYTRQHLGQQVAGNILLVNEESFIFGQPKLKERLILPRLFCVQLAWNVPYSLKCTVGRK